jgi:DNA (cytosine-5)-methyltransferase 1
MEGEAEVMRYGSVCSGIEAASAAWAPLGWRASFFSEIEPFPRAVLTHRYPRVPLHGDFTTIESNQYEPIDILVGGTPCQSFSVAGLRGGLADDRGNLALEYLRLAQRTRPRWLVWENVPGVLSSNGGRDFGSILGGMVQLGYGIAYRVLDAQFFGVAQRRRRVFVVGYLGDWRRAAAVLFERHSLSGNPSPRHQAGERPAPTIAARTKGGGRLGTDFDCDGGLVSMRLTSHPGRYDAESQTLITGTLCNNGKAAGSATQQDAENGFLVPMAFAHQQGGNIGLHTSSDCALTLQRHQGQAVAGTICRDSFSGGAGGRPEGAAQGHFLQHGNAVRRLTPRECERLQGFPDDYTLVPNRGKPAADGPRYKALGNSMAVPVMRWIGERIAAVETQKKGQPVKAGPRHN